MSDHAFLQDHGEIVVNTVVLSSVDGSGLVNVVGGFPNDFRKDFPIRILLGKGELVLEPAVLDRLLPKLVELLLQRRDALLEPSVFRPKKSMEAWETNETGYSSNVWQMPSVFTNRTSLWQNSERALFQSPAATLP